MPRVVSSLMVLQHTLELLGTYALQFRVLWLSRTKNTTGLGQVYWLLTAIGGGSIRDILLGSYPLVWIANIHFCTQLLLALPQLILI